jgi:histone H2B
MAKKQTEAKEAVSSTPKKAKRRVESFSIYIYKVMK